MHLKSHSTLSKPVSMPSIIGMSITFQIVSGYQQDSLFFLILFIKAEIRTDYHGNIIPGA